MLHPALGNNRFCGPGAMAALTGMSTDEAAAAIRKTTGKRAVFGVRAEDMLDTFCSLGYTWKRVTTPAHRSLEKVAPTLPHGVYLVNVTHHYVAVSVTDETGVVVLDNQSVTERQLMEFRRRNKHVVGVWEITRKEDA